MIVSVMYSNLIGLSVHIKERRQREVWSGKEGGDTGRSGKRGEKDMEIGEVRGKRLEGKKKRRMMEGTDGVRLDGQAGK